jgi:hypothetical protein
MGEEKAKDKSEV